MANTDKYGITWPIGFIETQMNILNKRIQQDDAEYGNFYNRVYVEGFKKYVQEEIKRRKEKWEEQQDKNALEKAEDKKHEKEINSKEPMSQSNFGIHELKTLFSQPTFVPSSDSQLPLLWEQYQQVVEELKDEKHQVNPDANKILSLNSSLEKRQEKLLPLAYSEYEKWFYSDERNKDESDKKKKDDEFFYPKKMQEEDFKSKKFPTREQDISDLNWLKEMHEVLSKILIKGVE